MQTWERREFHRGKLKKKVRVAHVNDMKKCKGSSGIAPLILNLSTSWRCLVSFIAMSLYLQGGKLSTH
jgi:hypothetical protein